MREKINGVINKLLMLLKELKIEKQQILVSFVYLLVLTLLHWKLKPDWEIVFFLAGGFFGVYFLDLAEMVFEGKTKNPFKNVVFQVVLVGLTIFVLTSSGSFFGAGLVLTMFLQMLLGQYQEFKQTASLNSWFWVIKTPISPRQQQIYLLVVSGIFILLNILFI